MFDSSPSFAAFADVAVDTPVRAPRVFSYGVPAHLPVDVGQPVWVPFGRPILPGIVVRLSDEPPPRGVRPILDILPLAPALTAEQIALARWIAEEYLTPLYEALALFLPPGATPRARGRVSLAPAAVPIGTDRPERRLIGLLQAAGPREQRELVTLAGRGAKASLDRLLRRGVVLLQPELEPAGVRARRQQTVWLDLDRETGQHEQARLRPAQRDLLERLESESLPERESRLSERLGVSVGRLRILAARGILRRFTTTELLRRDPLAGSPILDEARPILTQDQQQAVSAVGNALAGPPDPTGSRGIFLLRGVTGSGKTEVYLRAIAASIARGRQGIVLVPEIALTPQMIDRFRARFPGRVGVIHSRLSRGEQFDEWHRIRSGAVDLTIGSRGAVFAPLPRLGLIVVDEEHEWTYKQQGRPPIYEARAVAIRRAELTGAAVILGSATPDLVSRFRAEQGRYHLLTLPERPAAAHLPEVAVVDLRAELRAGNRSIFSRSLDQAIRTALAAREQVILFLNRRGAATFVQCRECGQALQCDRCDLPLTFHSTQQVLICHRCNARRATPDRCPACGSPRIKHFGLGTQRLEEETRLAYPAARVIRWDRDTTSGKHAHAALLRAFAAGEADILVGTQMIAKGLDVPRVTVVGVVNADVGLYLPDYRAAERTFQLLSQVAGRAGRGDRPGRVVIQTYSPEHAAIQAAARHDDEGFYRQEIEHRRALWNPPFARLTRLTYAGSGAGSAAREATGLAERLRTAVLDLGRPDLEILGPAPSFVPRQRGRYVWQIVLRGDEPQPVLTHCGLMPGWRVDVDPASLL